MVPAGDSEGKKTTKKESMRKEIEGEDKNDSWSWSSVEGKFFVMNNNRKKKVWELGGVGVSEKENTVLKVEARLTKLPQDKQSYED